MGLVTKIYFAILSTFCLFWVIALWFVENNATFTVKIMTTIALGLICIMGLIATLLNEGK